MIDVQKTQARASSPYPSLLAIRALSAFTAKGTGYFLHKTLRRTLSPWPNWKRRLVYSDPKQYWTHRGGEEYFLEQEGQADRTRRSLWLAERIARYQPTSILEIGCGYGKQLRALRRCRRSARDSRLCAD